MSTQLRRVAKVLRRNNTGVGISVKKLSKLAAVSPRNIYRRVYDLRENEGHTIYSNYRTVGGRKVLHYRFATND